MNTRYRPARTRPEADNLPVKLIDEVLTQVATNKPESASHQGANSTPISIICKRLPRFLLRASDGCPDRFSQARFGPENFCIVCLLPGQIEIRAPKVTIRGNMAIDRPLEAKIFDNGGRAEIKMSPYQFHDHVLVDPLRNKCLDVNRKRPCHPNSG